MRDARKRPCRICRRWFRPDNRVGDRQHACGQPECQQARRQQTQARWRARNPGYTAAHRITQRNQDKAASLVRTPPPLNQLPWDLAKDQFDRARCPPHRQAPPYSHARSGARDVARAPAAAPEIAPYVENLKRRGRKVVARLLRRLLRMLRDYPREAKAVLETNGAISTALPCRISVYQTPQGYKLATLLPTELMKLFGNPELEPVAAEVEQVVKAMIDEAC